MKKYTNEELNELFSEKKDEPKEELIEHKENITIDDLPEGSIKLWLKIRYFIVKLCHETSSISRFF